MMSTPLVGITCNSIGATNWTVEMGIAAPGQDFQGLAVDYLDMLERAGAIPVILPITKDLNRAEQLWGKLDGLLLSGGNDVSPLVYHERIAKNCGKLDNTRDAYEIAAAKYAIAHNLPVFGICRGIQLLNAALGGTNYQDLLTSGFEQHSILVNPRNEATHSVQLSKGSVLAGILQAEEVMVNSFHHQAVHELAPSLEAIAFSEDGVVEAVCVPGHPFAIATQWHPEMMFDSDQQLKIACAFVEACKNTKKI